MHWFAVATHKPRHRFPPYGLNLELFTILVLLHLHQPQFVTGRTENVPESDEAGALVGLCIRGFEIMSRKLVGGACLAVVLALLAGCGGGSAAGSAAGSTGSTGSSGSGSNNSSGSGGTTSQTVQGIATPSSVAVVTAK